MGPLENGKENTQFRYHFCSDFSLTLPARAYLCTLRVSVRVWLSQSVFQSSISTPPAYCF